MRDCRGEFARSKLTGMHVASSGQSVAVTCECDDRISTACINGSFIDMLNKMTQCLF